jgi:hypothetical protein
MKTWVLSIVLGVFVGSAATAWADSKAAAAKGPPAKSAAPAAAVPTAESLTSAATKGAQKPRVEDFRDETIHGSLTKPEGDLIDARKRAKQKSLIKIRQHFVPELLKSADDL